MKETIRSIVPASLLRAYKKWRNIREYEGASYATIFKRIYDQDLWSTPETRSGPGSTVAFTGCIRSQLTTWLAEKKIRFLVDIPCGDFNWMRHVHFPNEMRYLGIDIVEDIVTINQVHQSDLVEFRVGDLLVDRLPTADVCFCRDLLIHFPNVAVEKAIENVRASGTRYFVATTYPAIRVNEDTRFPDSRKQNLALYLGAPETMLPDFGAGIHDKFMGVWHLA